MDIIQHDYKLFISCFKEVELSDNYQRIVEKKNKILSKYSCFCKNFDNRDFLLKKKTQQIKKLKDISSPKKNGLHILAFSYSAESETKKQFTGILNKLTINPSQEFLDKISSYIQESSYKVENFNLLVCFIKRHRELNNVYIRIFDFLNNDFVEKQKESLFKIFLEEEEWVIPKEFCSIDIFSNSCDYNMFCDFKKWQEQTMTYVLFWCIVKKNAANLLIDEILQKIDPSSLRHIIDTYLEYLLIIKAYVPVSRFDAIKDFNINELNSSTKFKFQELFS